MVSWQHTGDSPGLFPRQPYASEHANATTAEIKPSEMPLQQQEVEICSPESPEPGVHNLTHINVIIQGNILHLYHELTPG